MKKIIFLFAALIAFGSANAQVTSGVTAGQAVSLIIPGVALIKVSGTLSTFKFTAPAAGENFIDATATGTSLQYTSILTTNIKRAIYVTSTGTSTKGFNLSVLATQNNTANGNGPRGTTTGVPSYIIVSSQTTPVIVNSGANVFNPVAGGFNVKLIDGIESCYTGSAATDGPTLTYTASVGTAAGGPAVLSADYAALRAATYVFQVFYTLADTV